MELPAWEIFELEQSDEPSSVYAVSAWVNGEPGSLRRVVGLTAGRMVFIAPGLFIAGERGAKNLLVKSAIVSSVLTLSLAALYKWGDPS